MSSFGLATATQHGTSGSSSSRSNRNSTILPSSGSDAYPSMYKRIGSSENITQFNTELSHSRTSSHNQAPAHQSSASSSSSHHNNNPNSIPTHSIRMSSSLTIQHDPNISNQLAKTSSQNNMASSQPTISLKNPSSSSPASSSGSSTQYYQHMINNHAQNGSDLIAIKCKVRIFTKFFKNLFSLTYLLLLQFEAEFRRFSLHRSDIKSLEEFHKTIEHFHKLFNVSFTLFYIDPLHGDLLPISNDINFKLAISSAKPLLRLVVQRKGKNIQQILQISVLNDFSFTYVNV